MSQVRRIAVALLAIGWLGPRAACGAGTRQLTITLTPAHAVAGGDIPYVDVSEVAPELQVAAGKPLLRLPLVSSNVTTVADALEDLRVRDSRGPLWLTIRDDRPSGLMFFRHCYANRAVAGTVTIRYRAPITNALNPRGAAPPLELRTEDGGFSGDADGATGRSAERGLDALYESGLYVMGGLVHVYPAPLPHEGFMSAWQGEPPFDARSLMRWTRTLYGSYLRFFRAPPGQPYAVFLRRNLVNAGGGVEVGRSFVGTFDEDTKEKDFELTLAHEMVHTFVGTLDEPQGLLSSWYAEGLAVYYQRGLPWRAGLIPTAEFLADLDTTAGRYYTDRLNDTPKREIPARFWADTRVRVLPYDRGSLYFAHLNAEIRRRTHGRRSLDDLVRRMIARRRRGQPVNEAAWIALVRQALGSRGVAQFHAMMSGKLVLPPSDAFGPCFERTTAPLRRYQLGFDSQVLMEPARIVRGLIPGSAAARAGLRDGDRIVKPVPQDAIQAQQRTTLTLLIERGGKTFPITYLPRGATVPAYQWRRRAAVPDRDCHL